MRDKITNKNSLIVGLTGSIASGKSLISAYFEKLGLYVIDADKIYSSLIQPNQPLIKLIAMEFGNNIIQADGSLNKKLLAEKVFSSEENRMKINRITHPFILREIIEKINNAPNEKIIIVTAPLIIETNTLELFDYIIVITCSLDQQIKRLTIRDNISEQEAIQKIKAQLSSEEKIKYADFVINNNSDIENAYKQAHAIYLKLLQKSKKI
jgi:dephospho-CoA kinase